jgi:hypothetical protein
VVFFNDCRHVAWILLLIAQQDHFFLLDDAATLKNSWKMRDLARAIPDWVRAAYKNGMCFSQFISQPFKLNCGFHSSVSTENRNHLPE